MCLIVAGGDALLVVGRRLIVGVDDGVRGHTVGVVRLSPGVDGVNIRNILENGAKKGEHLPSGNQKFKTNTNSNLLKNLVQGNFKLNADSKIRSGASTHGNEQVDTTIGF